MTKVFITSALFITASLFFTLFAIPSLTAYAQIPIMVNGERVRIPQGDAGPFIVDDGDGVLVPLRAIMEALEFDVEWNAQSMNVSVSSDMHDAVIYPYSAEMSVNGNIVMLDTPAQIQRSRTMIPLHVVYDITGMDAVWNLADGSVHIFDPLSKPEHWPAHLPAPGEIRLNPGVLHAQHPYAPPMRFRRVFYNIPIVFLQLVECPDEHEYFWEHVWSEYSETGNEYMGLMLFVRHFDISREDFDAVLNDYKARRLAAGRDLTDEEWEPPNADIIFTFDNDIIRWFYRRV